MYLIDIDGPSAVGKTTLIRSLHSKIPEACSVDELLMQKPNPYINWKTPEDFLQKQLWFFQNTFGRYADKEQGQKIQINDIGITDVILHTRIYPLANQLDWNIFSEFKNAVLSSYSNAAAGNIIFYLYASEKSIAERRQNDFQRVRNAFESNRKLFPYQREFYRYLSAKLPKQVHCVDAETGPSIVEQRVMRILANHMNSPKIPLRDLINAADLFFSDSFLTE